jgi:hypothetical protein
MTLIDHQYFIKLTNILHKLHDALVTSKLTLLQLAQIAVITSRFLLVIYLLNKEWKKTTKILNHCSGFAKLHFYLQFQQSSYKLCSLTFDPLQICKKHFCIVLATSTNSLSKDGDM